MGALFSTIMYAVVLNQIIATFPHGRVIAMNDRDQPAVGEIIVLTVVMNIVACTFGYSCALEHHHQHVSNRFFMPYAVGYAVGCACAYVTNAVGYAHAFVTKYRRHQQAINPLPYDVLVYLAVFNEERAGIQTFDSLLDVGLSTNPRFLTDVANSLMKIRSPFNRGPFQLHEWTMDFMPPLRLHVVLEVVLRLRKDVVLDVVLGLQADETGGRFRYSHAPLSSKLYWNKRWIAEDTFPSMDIQTKDEFKLFQIAKHYGVLHSNKILKLIPDREQAYEEQAVVARVEQVMGEQVIEELAIGDQAVVVVEFSMHLIKALREILLDHPEVLVALRASVFGISNVSSADTCLVIETIEQSIRLLDRRNGGAATPMDQFRGICSTMERSRDGPPSVCFGLILQKDDRRWGRRFFYGLIPRNEDVRPFELPPPPNANELVPIEITDSMWPGQPAAIRDLVGRTLSQ